MTRGSPLAAIEHSRVSKNTMHDILAILKWSLFQAFLGQYPQSRHDGTPWTKADGKRKRLAGAIGCRSALIRITGDWKLWKEIFKFPQWNETAGCCFRCAVTPGGLKDTGLSAPWRRRRLSHWDNIIRLRANALPVAPLFGLLHFDIAKICRLDWLHAADQGVTADLGQLYKIPLAPPWWREPQPRTGCLVERHPIWLRAPPDGIQIGHPHRGDAQPQCSLSEIEVLRS